MASYTMELRNYIEMFSQNEEINTRERIEKGRTKLFDFDYPIFDPDYKKVFETHFIRRFYMREIGFETEGLFKFYLENYLLINMPYWNKMFQSELLTFDVFNNTKVDTTQNKTNDRTQTSTSTTDGTSESTTDGTSEHTNHKTSSGTDAQDEFNRKIDSDTPDSRLNLTTQDGSGIIEYASKISEDKDSVSRETSGESNTTENGESHATSNDTTNVTSTGNATINDIEDFIESKVGKIGSQTYASMLQDYRETFLRLENQIFKEMEKELFMLVY